MASALVNIVSTVQLKRKVEKATTSEDEPAPGEWTNCLGKFVVWLTFI